MNYSDHFLEEFCPKKYNILNPDNKHLHSILHSYYLHRYKITQLSANNLSSLHIILVQLLNCFYVVNFYENEYFLIFGILLFIMIYEIAYINLNNKIKKF